MAALSMNEMTTYRWSFEEDVAEYAAAGIPAIGVWRQKLSDFGEERGIELLADSGLAVSNLLWVGGFTGSDGRSQRESIDDASEALRVAAALGADCLVAYSGARGGHTRNHARRLVREALGELLPQAAELGVPLAIEPMHEGCATEWTFLTSIEDALDLLSPFDEQSARLVFDTYHLGHDATVIDRIGQYVQRIAVVHLGDGKVPPDGEQDRCCLGCGAVPLKEIVAALSDAGYQGYYDVELMGEEIEACDYHQLIEQSKAAFNQLLSCHTL